MSKIPIKGPVGKDAEGHLDWPMPEEQERYEEEGAHADLVDGNFTQDPFSLKAPESDHTPNHTAAPKKEKAEYGKFSSGRFGL
jgi:hypothetical protein